MNEILMVIIIGLMLVLIGVNFLLIKLLNLKLEKIEIQIDYYMTKINDLEDEIEINDSEIRDIRIDLIGVKAVAETIHEILGSKK